MLFGPAPSIMSGYAQARGVGRRSAAIPQSAANSSRSDALSNLRYPGRLDAKPASRVPIALHCPGIEKGDAPGLPTLPVINARLLMTFTVSVLLVLWLTPIVQPNKGALALP